MGRSGGGVERQEFLVGCLGLVELAGVDVSQSQVLPRFQVRGIGLDGAAEERGRGGELAGLDGDQALLDLGGAAGGQVGELADEGIVEGEVHVARLCQVGGSSLLVAQAAVGHAERVVTAAGGGFGGERSFQVAGCGLGVAAVERQGADAIERRGELGLDFERAVPERGGFVGVAERGLGFGEALEGRDQVGFDRDRRAVGGGRRFEIAGGLAGEGGQVRPAMIGRIQAACFPVAVFGGLQRGECMAVEQLQPVVELAEFADRGCQVGVGCCVLFEGANAPLEACDL